MNLNKIPIGQYFDIPGTVIVVIGIALNSAISFFSLRH